MHTRKVFTVADLIDELRKYDSNKEVCVRDYADPNCVIELSGQVYYSKEERCVILDTEFTGL
jgi:hypothetical protein